jgi:hypothetical protein
MDSLRAPQTVSNSLISLYHIFIHFLADKLNGHFSRCGSIFNISILHKPSFENGREGIRDGIAKIKFFDKTSAAAAILDWNGREWFGGKLHLEWWSISKVLLGIRP